MNTTNATIESAESAQRVRQDRIISAVFEGADSRDGIEERDGAGLAPSDEDIQRAIAGVVEQAISPELRVWIKKYAEIGNRDDFLWKWCRRGVEVTTLPCTDADLREDVCDTKVLGVMLDVLLDDVADEQRDPAFLEYLLQLLDGTPAEGSLQLSADQRRYAEATADVWSEIHARLHRYPRHAEYAAVLQFDYRQLFNTMRYSQLLNGDPALLNLTEHDLYLPHNMHMMVSASMDLMCSPAFNHAELGTLREAAWRAQYMGRIGNLVTTWEREIGQRDYTSGVFASIVSAGDVAPAEIAAGDRSLIERAIRDGRHERRFLQRWRRCRDEILMLQPRVRSVDLGSLVSGLETLICLHLGSRGAK
ncbi:MAG: hypothetical protein ACE5KM_02755 [Planctomycetaceae bacterium]